MKKSSLIALSACASTAALMFAAPAFAEGDIIVTAEKRATNIQETPIAISAIGGDDLAARQISNVESLMSALPNVDFGLGLGNARIAIRGIGFDNITGGNEGRIAFHEDGVYYSRPFSVTPSFFDIERVEVLRGPQGTLYGRNATGGVVNVITRDTGKEANGYVNITGGNYGTLQTEGAVGGPLTDALSARFSFRTDNRDGYGENEVTGEDDVENLNLYALRGKVKYEPTDNFKLTLAGDYAFEKDHAYGYQFISPNPFNAPGLSTPRPVTGVLFGGVLPTGERNETGDRTRNRREFAGFSATAEYNFGKMDLVSISAWRKAKYDITGDADTTSARYLALDQFEDSDQYSEELRLSYTGEKLDWLIGGYYFDESLETGNRFAAAPGVGTPFFSPNNPATACFGVPCSPAFLDPRGLSAMYQPQGELDTTAWAIFGNVHYKLTEQAGVRLGLRYSTEKKKVFNQTKYAFVTFRDYEDLGFPDFPLPADTCGGVPFPGCIFTQQLDDTTYESLTPSITFDYKVNEDVYLYATYSTGMKSGGYNLGNNQPAFKKEKVTDYEAGIKADWLEGKLRTNLAAFYYDYKDAQATTILGSPPRIEIVNAPGAKQYGIELEATATPVENLQLDMDFAWLDTEYKGPFLSADSAAPWLGTLDNGGNQLVYAPKYTLNLGAEYTLRLSEMNVTLRGEANYKDRTYFDIFNNPYLSQGSFWKYNAFLTVAPENGPWSLQVFGRNLSNETTYSAMQAGAAFTGAAVYGAYAPPRTYGVTVGYKFN